MKGLMDVQSRIDVIEPDVIIPFSFTTAVSREITMSKFLEQGETSAAERIRDSRTTIHESDVMTDRNHFRPIFRPCENEQLHRSSNL